jgi:hypothetical protein
MVQRDDKGRVKSGSVLNTKGRPKREVEKNFLARMVSRVSPEDWDAIIDKAIQGAKRGDPADRKFLADYIIGPPVVKTDSKIDVSGSIRIIRDD